MQRTLILALATIGLGAATMSSYVHYKLLTDASYTSACDVSSTISCTQAYLSPYGSLWGVPVALGGVMFFAMVLVIAGLAGRPGAKGRENAPGYIFALSTLGAVVRPLSRLGLVLRAQDLLHPLRDHLRRGDRHLCHLRWSHDVSHEDFARSRAPRRSERWSRVPSRWSSRCSLPPEPRWRSRRFRRKRAASAQAVAAAPLPQVTDDERAKIAQWWEVQPKVDVPVPADGFKVLIVKFNDYQCPACKLTFEQYKQILPKYIAGGQVKYVVKQYPLEPECNPSVGQTCSRRVVRGGSRRADGEIEGDVRQAGRLDFLPPRSAASDARTGQGRGEDGWRDHRLRCAVRAREGGAQDRCRPGPAARRQVNADVLHQRPDADADPARRSTSRSSFSWNSNDPSSADVAQRHARCPQRYKSRS